MTPTSHLWLSFLGGFPVASAVEANVLPYFDGSGGNLVKRDVIPQPNGGHRDREVRHAVPTKRGYARSDWGEDVLRI